MSMDDYGQFSFVRKEGLLRRCFFADKQRSSQDKALQRDVEVIARKLLPVGLKNTYIQKDAQSTPGPTLLTAKLTQEAHAALTAFCLDVTLNIAWYERRLFWTKWALRLLVGFTVMIGAAATVATANWGGTKTSTGAEIAIVISAVLAMLQSLSSAVDVKTRLGGFWNAASEIKEVLFDLEARWAGKGLEESNVADGTTRLKLKGTADDPNALESELESSAKSARKSVNEETVSFFNTYKMPSDILSSLTSSLSALRTQRDALMTLHADEKQTRESLTQFQESVTKLSEAQKAVVENDSKSTRDQLGASVLNVIATAKKLSEVMPK